MELNNSEDKDKLIKAVINDNLETGQPHTIIRKLFNKNALSGSRVNILIIELIEEGLMDYFPSHERTNIKLTKSGQRAASIGYSILKNEVEEDAKESKHFTKEKTRLELKALQFNDTWKWTIILSAFISVAGFVLAALAYFKPIN